jgi:phage shock protein C
MAEEPKRLKRSKTNKVIAGVCGGVGEYFNVDPVIIRIIMLILVLGAGTGVVAYLIAWLVIPEED